MEKQVPADQVRLRIVEVRGAKVILDSDLAALYGVETSRLNERMKRNRERFPADFVFHLSREEIAEVRSRLAMPSPGLGNRRCSPFAYTERGVLMAASILHSRQAIDMSIFVVRAFVRLRSIYASHGDLTRRLDELDTKVSDHSQALRSIVEALRQLLTPAARDSRRLGSAPPRAASGHPEPLSERRLS